MVGVASVSAMKSPLSKKLRSALSPSNYKKGTVVYYKQIREGVPKKIGIGFDPNWILHNKVKVDGDMVIYHIDPDLMFQTRKGQRESSIEFLKKCDKQIRSIRVLKRRHNARSVIWTYILSDKKKWIRVGRKSRELLGLIELMRKHRKDGVQIAVLSSSKPLLNTRDLNLGYEKLVSKRRKLGKGAYGQVYITVDDMGTLRAEKVWIDAVCGGCVAKHERKAAKNSSLNWAYDEIERKKTEIDSAIKSNVPFSDEIWDRQNHDGTAFMKELIVSEKLAKLQTEKLKANVYKYHYLARILKAPFKYPGKDKPNIIMEACMGGNLESFRKENDCPTIFQCISWLAQLILGFEAMFDAGYLHSDFKPGNVVITHRGQIKICDFGTTKQVSKDSLCGVQDITSSRKRRKSCDNITTEYFMAGEVLKNNGEANSVSHGDRDTTKYKQDRKGYGTASDIFSLGTSMFWLTTKRYPAFSKTNADAAKVGFKCEDARLECFHSAGEECWNQNKSQRKGRPCKCWVRDCNGRTFARLKDSIGWSEDECRNMDDLINWMVHPEEKERMTLHDFWKSERTKWLDDVINDYANPGTSKPVLERVWNRDSFRDELENKHCSPDGPDRRAFCDEDTYAKVKTVVCDTMDKLSRA